MQAPAACLAGVLAILIAAPARADLADYLDKPVSSVRLTIEGRDSDER